MHEWGFEDGEDGHISRVVWNEHEKPTPSLPAGWGHVQGSAVFLRRLWRASDTACLPSPGALPGGAETGDLLQNGQAKLYEYSATRCVWGQQGAPGVLRVAVAQALKSTHAPTAAVEPDNGDIAAAAEERGPNLRQDPRVEVLDDLHHDDRLARHVELTQVRGEQLHRRRRVCRIRRTRRICRTL